MEGVRFRHRWPGSVATPLQGSPCTRSGRRVVKNRGLALVYMQLLQPQLALPGHGLAVGVEGGVAGGATHITLVVTVCDAL